MTLSQIKLVGSVLFIASLGAVSCKPKPPAAPPPAATTTTPPAPPAPAPTITLRAQPATIDRGGSTTLQWEARNAATVSITPGVGDVPLSGNRSVNPASSVSYQATATGPGGTATDVARVTVNIPPAPPANTTPNKPPVVTSNPVFDRDVRDVLFDYDQSEIRPDMLSVLQSNTTWLRMNPNVRFTIEGHCDDRGSEEYNLGLGDRRANAVKEYLVSQGIPANRINTVSYGEERPVCRDETEECYARNRRAHFTETR